MTDTKPIRRIAIIGTGVIGASWTALFLAKGLQVVATDVAPNAEAALRKFVEAAWPASQSGQSSRQRRCLVVRRPGCTSSSKAPSRSAATILRRRPAVSPTRWATR